MDSDDTIAYQCPFCTGKVLDEPAIPELGWRGIGHTLPHCKEFENHAESGLDDLIRFLDAAITLSERGVQ